MKGAKKCIKLLTLFITFLLSLSLFSNASAIEQIKIVNNRNPSSVEWTYRDGTGQGEISQSANLEYYVLRGVTLAANANKTAALTNLKINLRTNINLSKKKYYKFTIYFTADPTFAEHTFSVPVCPRGKAPFVIDKCDITHIENESEIYRIREELLDPSDNFKYSQVYAYTQYFYSMVITGHYNSDTQTSLGYLEFQNPFYEYYNNSALSGASITLYIYFTPVDEIEYELDAQDEAAEKELEDRDNLETQQSSTSTDSNSSQQQAQSTGTTLLAAFSSFVSAITSSSPSNCKIDMDMGNLDLGLVDFCTLSPPAPVQTIASIFMILFCVPLSIATARKVISLFRSFQR